MRFRVALSNSARVSVLVNNFPPPPYIFTFYFFLSSPLLLLLLLKSTAPAGYLSYLIDSSGLELGKNKLWVRDKGAESGRERWREGHSRIRWPSTASRVNVKRIVASVAVRLKCPVYGRSTARNSSPVVNRRGDR